MSNCQTLILTASYIQRWPIWQRKMPASIPRQSVSVSQRWVSTRNISDVNTFFSWLKRASARLTGCLLSSPVTAAVSWRRHVRSRWHQVLLSPFSPNARHVWLAESCQQRAETKTSLTLIFQSPLNFDAASHAERDIATAILSVLPSYHVRLSETPEYCVETVTVKHIIPASYVTNSQ